MRPPVHCCRSCRSAGSARGAAHRRARLALHSIPVPPAHIVTHRGRIVPVTARRKSRPCASMQLRAPPMRRTVSRAVCQGAQGGRQPRAWPAPGRDAPLAEKAGLLQYQRTPRASSGLYSKAVARFGGATSASASEYTALLSVMLTALRSSCAMAGTAS